MSDLGIVVDGRNSLRNVRGGEGRILEISQERMYRREEEGRSSPLSPVPLACHVRAHGRVETLSSPLPSLLLFVVPVEAWNHSAGNIIQTEAFSIYLPVCYCIELTGNRERVKNCIVSSGMLPWKPPKLSAILCLDSGAW